MRVSVIAAADRGNIIGRNGDMPWHLPCDLRYFRRRTLGHHVLFGRKTALPLDRRTVLALTRDDSFAMDGVRVVHSLEAGLAIARAADEDEFFIGGGGVVYRLAFGLDIVDRVYLTRVHETFLGNVTFPTESLIGFSLVSEQYREADERNLACTFQVYERKRP